MITFYPVYVDEVITAKNPLFVGHFFKLSGMWWTKRKQRQGLIISIASAWYRLYNQNPKAPAFVEAEVYITHLTKQVKDAKVILEYFFNINRLGFNFGSDKSPTLISPKKLNKKIYNAVDAIINQLKFDPGVEPTSNNFEVSKVTIQQNISVSVKNRLREENRLDLIAPVNWLLDQNQPINFYFKPSGSLKQRDTSVWPIKAIETWPGWLRTMLFGAVVDIENAFSQFLIKKLEVKYQSNPSRLQTLYPILLESINNKQQFRENICKDILKLPVTDESISLVKKVVMSIANGSNISAGLILCSNSKSQSANLVREIAPHLSTSDQIYAGEQLNKIAKQFKRARKDLCFYMFNEKPTASNQKKIFIEYFTWERQSRYAMWEAVGRTGLHLHDGLDGIENFGLNRTELLDMIIGKTNVNVSVDFPEAII